MDARYPDARRFNSRTELRECAKRVVDNYLHGTDDAPAFAAGDIADYERPHAIALAARVYATLGASNRDGFESVLEQVAFGTYRSVMTRFRDEPDDELRIELRPPVEREASCAIGLLAENLAERLRDGTDDAYAATAYTIVRMSVEFAILVTFIVCSVLDGRRNRRIREPPADGRRQVEKFAAFLAQAAIGGDRSVKPRP